MVSAPIDAQWPELAEPHEGALRDVVGWILERFEPLGIVASGSVVRGTGDAASDLDVYVVVGALERQRIQRYHQGVPVEIFVNPAVAVRRYFESEHASARPVTAHLLATGVVVLDRDPVVRALLDEARAWLARQQPWPDAEETMERYLVATLYEDAVDVIHRDAALGTLLLWRSVHGMLTHRCRRDLQRVPRQKDLLASVEGLDPELGRLVRGLEAASGVEARLRIAGAIADRTLGVRGFFEWQSAVEPVAP
jgi:predicted nucleotidyltransferase